MCIVVTAAGLLVWFVCVKSGRKKEYRIYCLIWMISGVLGTLVCLDDAGQKSDLSGGIERPEPGFGAMEEDYVLSVEELSIDEPYRVTVENRHLTEQELEELFSQAVEELMSLFLGENESLDRITHDVVLSDSVVEGRVSVSWSFDDYEAVNLSGELMEDALSEEGSLVQVTVVMEYEDVQAEHHFSMMVYPPEKTARERFYELLEKEVQTRNANTEAVFVLPEQIAGYKVNWKRQPQREPYQILLIGLCAMAGVGIGRKEDEKKAREQRNARLLADYPQMLSQMSLLLGAGMTVSFAWERIVLSYEGRKRPEPVKHTQLRGVERANQAAGASRQSSEEIPVYEEMRITYHQMKDGLGERMAYEQFGERIGLQAYRRLATLLVQNLRKGTAGLSRLLEKEMQHAFEAQENDAKKRGEELQTKLLLPMMLMLALVIVIIMIPAIASFQL